MIPFFLVLGCFALLHLPGLRKWPGGPRPADKAAGALGLVLFLPGVLHFTQAGTFEAMMPPFLPWHAELVAISGVAEILIAVGLLVPATRRSAGWSAVALFLAVWPANLYLAWSGRAPDVLGQSELRAWIRVPFQILYLGWGAWIGLGHIPGAAIRRRLFARYYDGVQAGYEKYMEPRRRGLLAAVRGKVLEIGPGTGANLAYYDQSVQWIGVEPSPYMREQLSARAQELGIRPEFRDYAAGSLPAEDASLDAVISTLVLCSVPDPGATLVEIRRVLKPGGRFVFLEHVAAPRGSRLRRAQDLLRPAWAFFTDGCHPNRELAAKIRAAGFDAVELEEFVVPKEHGIALVGPHIAGVATSAACGGS